VDDQPTRLFPANKLPSGSFLVRNTAFVQAHTTLDKAVSSLSEEGVPHYVKVIKRHDFNWLESVLME
jgi:hypothetical protein